MAAYTSVKMWNGSSLWNPISKAKQLLSPCCIHMQTFNKVHYLFSKRETITTGLMPTNTVARSSNRTYPTATCVQKHIQHSFQFQRHFMGRGQVKSSCAVFKNSLNSACYTNVFLGREDNKPNLPGQSRRRMCSVSGVCWNCSSTHSPTESAAAFFCQKCNVIQPVSDDLTHFQRMQCEERYDIDVGQLTQTFRSLQRQLHPDKYSNKSQKEQAYSADQSSAVNKAYSMLFKPLSRGLYLLQLHGYSIEESDSEVEPEFLMEVMETNEQLAETQNMDTVKQIRAQNSAKLNELIQKLTQVFSNKNFAEARNILVHLKYYANIEDKAKDILGTDA